MLGVAPDWLRRGHSIGSGRRSELRAAASGETQGTWCGGCGKANQRQWRAAGGVIHTAARRGQWREGHRAVVGRGLRCISCCQTGTDGPSYVLLRLGSWCVRIRIGAGDTAPYSDPPPHPLYLSPQMSHPEQSMSQDLEMQQAECSSQSSADTGTPQSSQPGAGSESCAGLSPGDCSGTSSAMASADLRQELVCSICLNIYTDPVTLKCGHNFCRDCIDRVLDTQELSGTYTCPECRAKVKRRPSLQRNKTLCNIVGSYLSTRPDQEKTGIFCTYCIHSPIPAAKSCLHCEAHLCDNHLRLHSKSPEHVLSDPTTALGTRKCSVHNRVLEYYCSKSSACICVSCLIGEHKGHQVEMLDAAYEKKKEKLRDVLQKLSAKRAETEKSVQSLQRCRSEDQWEAEEVTVLFRDMRSRFEDLENRVQREISKQKERVSLSVSDMNQQLDELSKKMRHIEELCNSSDPVTVLQDPDTDNMCHTEGRKRRHTQVHDGGNLDVGVIKETLSHLSDIITGINVCFYGHKAAPILLDVTTASPNIQISDDRKIAYIANQERKCRVPKARFKDFPQVMSTRGFSSGQHYWDVYVSESKDWKVGMCYPSIARRGEQSAIGENDKSWCMRAWFNNYTAIHDEIDTWVTNMLCDRVRVYLDYEAGQLSFYALCDPIRHLYTYTATFTEPLHAVLGVCVGAITI